MVFLLGSLQKSTDGINWRLVQQHGDPINQPNQTDEWLPPSNSRASKYTNDEWTLSEESTNSSRTVNYCTGIVIRIPAVPIFCMVSMHTLYVRVGNTTTLATNYFDIVIDLWYRLQTTPKQQCRGLFTNSIVIGHQTCCELSE